MRLVHPFQFARRCPREVGAVDHETDSKIGSRMAGNFADWQALVAKGVPDDEAAAWAATPTASVRTALALHRAGVTPDEFQMWVDAGLGSQPLVLLSWLNAGWTVAEAIGWARVPGISPLDASRLSALGFSPGAWFGWLRCGLDPEAVPERWRDAEPLSAMRADELLAERCATQGDELARAWAAAAGWPGLLRLLARDQDERVRAVVAASDRLGGEAVEALLARPSARVCYVLAANRAAPQAARERARALLRAGSAPADEIWLIEQHTDLLPETSVPPTDEVAATVLEQTWASLDDPLSGSACVHRADG